MSAVPTASAGARRSRSPRPRRSRRNGTRDCREACTPQNPVRGARRAGTELATASDARSAEITAGATSAELEWRRENDSRVRRTPSVIRASRPHRRHYRGCTIAYSRASGGAVAPRFEPLGATRIGRNGILCAARAGSERLRTRARAASCPRPILPNSRTSRTYYFSVAPHTLYLSAVLRYR